MGEIFEIREHTADVGIYARGDTIEATFAAMADGLAAASCDDWPNEGTRFDVRIEAEGLEAALFDYLDELIYQRDVRDVLPVENRVTISLDEDRWTVEGSARGVPTDRIAGREIKAVTYSEMEITETQSGWEAYVVFDV